MTDLELSQLMEQAAASGARIAAAETRERGIMPFKIRVSIWSRKDDGTYANTEYEAVIDPILYEASFQEYMRQRQNLEMTKDEVLNELRGIISDFNTPQKSDDQGSDETTPQSGDE